MLVPNAVPNNVVDKSAEDFRTYRLIELENGIRVLLISNVEPRESEGPSVNLTDNASTLEGEFQRCLRPKGAAAMCVGVGYFSDPPDVPGLAHFIEHLVFLDSEKYPGKNFLDSFIQQHGGSSNAQTSEDYTVFYFDVQREHFHEALEIFAQLFINPLMKTESIESEVSAVDSEFTMAKENENRIITHLLTILAKPGHPKGKFYCGNEATLKELPRKHGIDMYRECHNFRRRYHSSHFMTLAVEVSEALDVVESWVRKIFSTITNNGRSQPTFENRLNAFEMRDFNKIYKAVSQETVKTMTLTWYLPFTTIEHYITKPSHYVGWLINCAGSGGIGPYLGNRQWATSVSCDYKYNYQMKNETGYCFTIFVILTDEGYRKLYDVITAVFDYLEFLRLSGIREDIYTFVANEMKRDFTWNLPLTSGDDIALIARAMQMYPPKHYLTGTSQLLCYKEEVISQFLQHLTPEKCNVMVKSRAFEDTGGLILKTNQLYGLKYYVSDFEQQWLSRWKKLQPRDEFSFPEHYRDNSEDLLIKPSNPEWNVRPKVLKTNKKLEIWYMQRSQFREPCGYVYLHLISPSVYKTAESASTLDIFVCMLKSRIEAVLSSTFWYDMWTTHSGVAVKICGFDSEIMECFEGIMDAIFELKTYKNEFELAKKVQMNMYSSLIGNPVTLAWDLLDHFTNDHMWTMADRKKALMGLSLYDLEYFIYTFYRHLKVDGYIRGNFTHEDAHELVYFIESKLKNVDLSMIAVETEARIIQLPKGTRYCRVSNLNRDDVTSTVLDYYQIGPCNLSTYVLTRILTSALHQKSFNVLRTREQLSYNVACMIHMCHNVVGIVMKVEPSSTKISIRDTEETIEEFLTEFNEKLPTFQNEFDNYVKSLVNELQSPFFLMENEADHHWYEILDQNYLFNRRKLEVERAKALSLEDLRRLFESTMLNKDRRKLSIQVVSTGMAEQSQRIAEIRRKNLRSVYLRKHRNLVVQGAPKSIGSTAVARHSSQPIDELEYLQEAQPDDSIDDKSIDNPIVFKKSQRRFSKSKVLEYLPSEEEEN